ncbi:MAG: SDR family oxidoreductase [Chloroherpetonaceae bacterium]
MNKNVLIIGGTSDIGFAIASEFAHIGFDITLIGRERDALKVNANDLSIRHNINANYYFLDILDLSSIDEFLNNYKQVPDGVIYSIGYLGDQAKAQNEFDEAKKILDINFTNSMKILNHFANQFEQKQSGFIIGISSVAGDRGRQSNYIYGSAKAAFSTYLSGLRNRLSGKNVQVITVKPGFVRTKMTAGLPLPEKLTSTPKMVAKDVIKGWKKHKDIIYTKSIWRWIMLAIKIVPEKIFKKTNI